MAAHTDEQRQSWPPPNYDNPDNLDALVIGMTVPSLILAVTCEYPIWQMSTSL